MAYRVDAVMVERLWERNADLLRLLRVGRRWLRVSALCFNAWVFEMVANGETEGRPLAAGEPWNCLFEHLVWDYERVSEYAPTLLELCADASQLPEMATPGAWRGFARRLTSDDPGHFRSALAELAVHRWVRGRGAGITFNFGPPDRPRCDYTITLPTRTVSAELKSLLPGIHSADAATHYIKRVYAEAFTKQQLARDGNSLVFVDISGWHGFAIGTFLSEMAHREAPRRVKLPQVAAGCKAEADVGFDVAPLLLVMLDPTAAQVARVVEVEAPTTDC